MSATLDLTLAAAARMIRAAMKDKSYRATPLGQEVGAFMCWFRNEFGATPESYRDYEAILAKLALDYADLTLSDFEPPEGTRLLREFIDCRWSDAAPRTRKKVRAVLMSFFRHAVGEFKLRGNPVEAIRSPRQRGVERNLFTAERAARLIHDAPDRSSRVALRLLFELALRKNKLRLIRFKDFDLGRRRLRVRGKGGTIIDVPIPTEDLRLELEALILERQPDPMEYLLYPVKRGPLLGQRKRTGAHEIGVIAEYKRKPLDANGMQRWWKRCIEAAGIPYLNMQPLDTRQ